MGYNASVVVLCDQLSAIENDPEFGKKLAAAIRWRGTHRAGSDDFFAPHVTGQTQVVCVEHADYLQIVAIGGNTGRVLGFSHRLMEDDGVIEGLNRERLARKRAAKAAS